MAEAPQRPQLVGRKGIVGTPKNGRAREIALSDEARAPLKAVQQLLDHSTMEMTMRYSHLSPDVRRDVVALLDRRCIPVAMEVGGEPASRHARVTRGGVNAEAVPRQRGRERPLKMVEVAGVEPDR